MWLKNKGKCLFLQAKNVSQIKIKQFQMHNALVALILSTASAIRWSLNIIFVLWIAKILQNIDGDADWDTASANCAALCPMCHLPRPYDAQQGMELQSYGKEFDENLLMYKLIWNIRFLNCVFFYFYFAALIRLYSQKKLVIRGAKSVFNIDFNV